MSAVAVDLTVPHPKGCPGRLMRISGTTAAICYGCTRYGLQGSQIEPKAALDPASNVWQCEERLSDFMSNSGGNAV